MAIQIEYTHRANGVVLPAAYARVHEVRIRTLQRVADVTVAIYRDEDARRSGFDPVHYVFLPAEGDEFDDYFSSTVLDSRSVYRQAYAYVKTVPLFSGGVDV